MNNEIVQTQSLNENKEQKNDNEQDRLIKAFIGQKYDKFKTGKFNLGALLLGPLYLFYRKMILFGLVLFTLQLLIYDKIFPYNVILPLLITNLILSFTVNKLYLFLAKRKTSSLSKKYKDEELLKECSNKGGTSIGIAILGVFLEIVILFVYIILSTGIHASKAYFEAFVEGRNVDSFYDIDDEYNYNNAFSKKYTYSVPRELIKPSQEEKYEFTDGQSKCEYAMAEITNKILAKQYSESMAGQYDLKVQEKTINGIKWYEVDEEYREDDEEEEETSYSYNYFAEKDNRIYIFEYSYTKPSNQCIQIKDQILNSIKEK